MRSIEAELHVLRSVVWVLMKLTWWFFFSLVGIMSLPEALLSEMLPPWLRIILFALGAYGAICVLQGTDCVLRITRALAPSMTTDKPAAGAPAKPSPAAHPDYADDAIA